MGIRKKKVNTNWVVFSTVNNRAYKFNPTLAKKQKKEKETYNELRKIQPSINNGCTL